MRWGTLFRTEPRRRVPPQLERGVSIVAGKINTLRSVAVGTVATVIFAMAATPAMAVTYRSTARASTSSSGGQIATGAYGPAVVNASASRILFLSTDASLPSGGSPHVYMKDTSTGTVRIVDRDAANNAADGAPDSADVSDSGARVVLSTLASNFDPADTNGQRDVYVWQDSPVVLTRISSPGPLQSANGQSFEPTISGDGAKVAFASTASNLVASDANGQSDVFTASAAGGSLKLVTTVDGGTASANGDSYRARMSGDGKHVAFISDASNLIANACPGTGDCAGFRDVFVYDSVKNDVVRVSVSSSGAEGNANSGGFEVSISDNGRFVAFESAASNLVAGDANGRTDVFVHDRDADGNGTFDETAPGGRATYRIGGNGDSAFPALSGDGALVLFRSEASNLVAGDTNLAADLFVAKRDGTGISRVNVPDSLSQSTGLTYPWGMTADGTRMLFETDASLEAADTNGVSDLYIHRFSPPATPTLSSPAANQLFGTTGITVAGTASDPGLTIAVRLAGATIASTTSGAAGAFSLPVTLPAPTAAAGASHTLSVVAIDSAYESLAATRTVRVDTIAPALALTSPGNGSTIGDSFPTYAGTAGIATGASNDAGTVSVTVKDASSAIVEAFPSVSVDASGAWSTVGTVALANANYSVTVTQSDAVPNLSTVTNTFTVNAGVPTVSITSPVDGISTNASVVTASGAATLPGGGSPSTVNIKIHAGSTTAGPLVGSPVAVTPVAGAWTATLPSLPDGVYTLQASATTLAGTGTSGAVTITIDTATPLAPTITAPLGAISTNSPTATGTGEAGTTLLLELNGSLVATIVVPTSGNWSVPLGPLAEGNHTLRARLRDGAGNESPPRIAAFSIDLTAPAAPLITTPVEGATLSGPGVGIGGSGEAGSAVVIREQATVLGSTVVSPSGGWSVNVASMAGGPHAVTATQTDAAGNDSPPSAVRNFVIDPLAVPTIIHQPLQNATLATRDIQVSGTAIAGGSVRLFIVDGLTETAIGAPAAVSASGAWATSIRRDDGAHHIIARETVGGTASQVRDFVVASGIPVIASPAAGSRTPRTINVAGTARANSSVTVKDSALTLGTTTSAPDGSFALTVTLSEGSHTIRAFAGTGQYRTEDSDPVTFTVDGSGPQTSVAPDAQIMGTQAGTPVRISGSATDPSKVSVIEVTYRNVLTGAALRSSTLSPASPVICTGCGTGTSVQFEHSPSLGTGYWSVEVIAYDGVGNAGARAGASFLVLI